MDDPTGDSATWAVERDGDLVLAVHAQPGARKSGVAGVHGDALKIRLAAPPVDGKANAELIRYLAQVCAVARSGVRIERGASSRDKRVRIAGAPPAEVRRALRRLLAPEA